VGGRQFTEDDGRTLGPQLWAGVVDCVGGTALAEALRTVRYGGAVAASGLTGGNDLTTTVYPFIVRGVALLGIDTVATPIEERRDLWADMPDAFPLGQCEEMVNEEIGLGELTATAGLTWAQLLKRPEVTIEPVMSALREDLEAEPLLKEMAALTSQNPSQAGTASLRNEARAVETEIKFAGYLEQQKKSIAKLKAAEAVAIPEWLEYGVISGLSREMREKLERVRPGTIGQASRISGVTPAALSLVHVSIRLQGARRQTGKQAGVVAEASGDKRY